MKLNRWFLLALLLLIPALAGAQGPGLFIRSDCTAITSPVTGSSWCFDSTAQQVKFWNGTTWTANTSGAPAGTGYVKASGLVFSSVQTVPIPIADGGTGLTIGTSGGVLGYTATNVLASSALLTANALVIGGGAGATPTTAVLTNGQLPIGNTGSAPTLAALTGTTMNLTVTNGAGSITLASLLHGQVRLVFTSATVITLNRYNGGNIIINGALFRLPAGATNASNTNINIDGVAASNLAASTTYFIYLFNSSGTLTIDFSTTTHATDTTAANLGVEIKSGDSTRSLIGMVRTNGSSQFEDDNSLRGVISWFNRREIGLVNGFTTGRATTSATYVELNSEIRGNFVTWGDEAVSVFVSGGVISGTAGTQVSTAIGFDGTTAEDAMNITFIQILNYTIGVATGLVKNGLAEGFHYATCLGLTTGAVSTTWSGAAIGAQRTSLSVGIRG